MSAEDAKLIPLVTQEGLLLPYRKQKAAALMLNSAFPSSSLISLSGEKKLYQSN